VDENARRWLYALSSPMAALNGASYTSATYFEGEDTSNLEHAWGIDGRERLLDTLSMADAGHACELNDLYWQYQRCLPSQWRALLDSLPRRARRLHEYVASTFADCGDGGTRAWDLGRMSYLLRVGTLRGYIDEDESLYLHYRLSLRARHYYESWNRYLTGYLLGKALWNVSDLDDDAFDAALPRQGSDHWNRCIALNLSQGASEVLASLPWHLPLPELERPASLPREGWS